jgi:hypothetical protein
MSLPWIILLALLGLLVLVLAVQFRHKFGQHGYVLYTLPRNCSRCTVGFRRGGHVHCNCGRVSPHVANRSERNRWLTRHRQTVRTRTRT